MLLGRVFTQSIVRHSLSRQLYQSKSYGSAAVTMATVKRFSTSHILRDKLADAEQQMNLGTQQLNQGSVDMAMNHYYRSVQLAPTPAGYFNIGVCYFQMGKYKDAIQSFEKSLELDPISADCHTNIASTYLMMSNVQPAIEHLEKASNFNPLDGEVHYNLGCVYQATGKVDEARTRLERAKDLGIPQATKALEKLNKETNK